MCVEIIDPAGDSIVRQSDLVTFRETIGLPGDLVMRDGMAPNLDECLCWVDLHASLLGTGYVAVSAWDSHGADYRLDPAPSLTPSEPDPT